MTKVIVGLDASGMLELVDVVCERDSEIRYASLKRRPAGRLCQGRSEGGAAAGLRRPGGPSVAGPVGVVKRAAARAEVPHSKPGRERRYNPPESTRP